MKLTRHPANPILEPIPEHPWESRNVYNAAVIEHEGRIVLIYRAQGTANDISRLGHAVSNDGVHFERSPEPVFVPETADEAQGVEAPRLLRADDAPAERGAGQALGHRARGQNDRPGLDLRAVELAADVDRLFR